MFPFHVAVQQRSSEKNIASKDQKSTLTRIDKNDHRINQGHLFRSNNFRNSGALLYPPRLRQSFQSWRLDVRHHTSSRTLVAHEWQILAVSWMKCPVAAGSYKSEKEQNDDQLQSSAHWSIFCAKRKAEYTRVSCTDQDWTYKKCNILFWLCTSIKDQLSSLKIETHQISLRGQK